MHYFYKVLYSHKYAAQRAKASHSADCTCNKTSTPKSGQENKLDHNIMEKNTFLLLSSPSSRESARTSVGVVGNPDLAAGLLLGYFFLGLASYIWAFWSQRNKLRAVKEAVLLSCSEPRGTLRGIQNIYSCLLTVFFTDILNALPAIIWAIELARSRCSSGINCDYVFMAWHLSRYFGVILHIENALVYLHFLRNPQWGAQQRAVYISLVFLMLVIVPSYKFLGQWAVYVLGSITIGLAVDVIAKSVGSNMSPSAATQKIPIVIVAMLTFLIVFLPSFILECLVYSEARYGIINSYYNIAYLNAIFFTSVQLTLDGLLCYFILKLPFEEEEPQQEQPQQHQIWGNENYVMSANVKNVNVV